MILIQPEKGIGQKEIPDLVSAEIKNQGAPVLVLSFFGIGVFIEGRTVKPAQAVIILGEMGRHPVQDDPNPGLVTGIH